LGGEEEEDAAENDRAAVDAALNSKSRWAAISHGVGSMVLKEAGDSEGKLSVDGDRGLDTKQMPCNDVRLSRNEVALCDDL
jgi:hypothetical protein